MSEEEFLIEMKNFFENIDKLKADFEEQVKETELAKVMTLKGFTDKYNNKLIIKDIILVLKNLKTLKNNNENRKYNARRVENLKCVEEKK